MVIRSGALSTTGTFMKSTNVNSRLVRSAGYIFVQLPGNFVIIGTLGMNISETL